MPPQPAYRKRVVIEPFGTRVIRIAGEPGTPIVTADRRDHRNLDEFLEAALRHDAAVECGRFADAHLPRSRGREPEQPDPERQWIQAALRLLRAAPREPLASAAALHSRADLRRYAQLVQRADRGRGPVLAPALPGQLDRRQVECLGGRTLRRHRRRQPLPLRLRHEHAPRTRRAAARSARWLRTGDLRAAQRVVRPAHGVERTALHGPLRSGEQLARVDADPSTLAIAQSRLSRFAAPRRMRRGITLLGRLAGATVSCRC